MRARARHLSKDEEIDEIKQEVTQLCVAELRYGWSFATHDMIVNLTLVVDQYGAVKEAERIREEVRLWHAWMSKLWTGG